MRRPALAGALIAGLLLGTTACSGSAGGDAVDGQVRVVDQPGDPITLTGTDLDGKPLSLADFAGKPTVVVLWGSWCGPCIGEAPDVVEVANELDGVAHFVGIDIRDPSVDNAQSYVREFDVPYPPFYSPDSSALLPFGDSFGPNSPPAFAVLDPQGRVTATILGPLPGKVTLKDLVDDAAGTSAGTGAGESTDG